MSKNISKPKRIKIYQKYKGRCAYCGVKIDYDHMHVDHIIPLYRKWSNEELSKYGKVKGTNKIENLNPACPTCNISKSTFSLDEWRDAILNKLVLLRENVTNFRIVEKHKLIKVIEKPVIFYFEKEVKNG